MRFALTGDTGGDLGFASEPVEVGGIFQERQAFDALERDIRRDARVGEVGGVNGDEAFAAAAVELDVAEVDPEDAGLEVRRNVRLADFDLFVEEAADGEAGVGVDDVEEREVVGLGAPAGALREAANLRSGAPAGWLSEGLRSTAEFPVLPVSRPAASRGRALVAAMSRMARPGWH